MKVPYDEGVATHIDPESCADGRKEMGEALTGARAGRVLSREMVIVQGADAVGRGGRHHWRGRYGEVPSAPARSQTPSTFARILHGSREIPRSTPRDGKGVRVENPTGAMRR